MTIVRQYSDHNSLTIRPSVQTVSMHFPGLCLSGGCAKPPLTEGPSMAERIPSYPLLQRTRRVFSLETDSLPGRLATITGFCRSLDAIKRAVMRFSPTQTPRFPQTPTCVQQLPTKTILGRFILRYPEAKAHLIHKLAPARAILEFPKSLVS